MKRRFTILTAALALLVCLAIPMGMWGQTRTEINWSASEQGYSNQQAIESVTFDSNVSAAFNKGTNNNSPKYYTSGTAIRCYGGNYFVISTASGNLTRIAITFGSSDGSNAITTDVGTYTSGTWTGSANSVKFTIGGTSGNRRIAGFTIEYSTGGNPTCATPTFSPGSGTYTEAQTVSISCATEGATIQYKTTENGEWQNYSTVINVSETTTIWARATKTGMHESEIATATYTIVIIEHAGTEADPYSVADARNLIDLGEPYPQNVCATGIVSEIVTAYNSQYGNITYNISTDGTTASAQLQAFRGKSYNGENFTSADDIQVGDIVVVKGNLTKYNSTYEFDANNQLVSLVRPVTPAINAENVSISYDATNGSIAYTIDNGVEGGVLTATTEAQWITLGTVGNDAVPFTCSVNNQVAGRSATVTLTYTYNTNETVTKTVTITQAGNVPTPGDGDYVRISSLDQLTNGSIVIIAARYNTNASNYYAMKNTIDNGKASGVGFVSTTSNNLEKLPTSIVDNQNEYYWVVNKTENSYTFTNANGQVIGWLTGANFNIGESNAHNEWTISTGTTGSNSLVATYSAFNIKNATTASRAFAFRNSTKVFGPYAISGNNNNSNNNDYNFSLDIFVQAYTKHITGYTNNGGYYLIASPIGTVNPTEVTNMITPNDSDNNRTYDLYRFDQNPSDGLEWRNYRQGAFNLNIGQGYLYAHRTDVDLVFTGSAISGSTYDVPLTKSASASGHEFPDWNLVGNPFADVAHIDGGHPFYTLDVSGAYTLVSEGSQNIENMQGVFVVAGENEESITFVKGESSKKSPKVTLNVSKGTEAGVIDRAIVCFGETRQMPKFQLFKNSTKVYIPMEGKDYALVRGEEMGAMPVNFKAEENGTYSMNFSCENVGFAYLHLIDNKTGNDIDLLKTPSYSFEAKTTDYESRFKLVFATGDNSNDDNFAFFSNGSFVINNEGNAELQVIDITGRIVKSESVNGCTNVNVNAAPGVYMLRLVNGDNVKVQKVVVK